MADTSFSKPSHTNGPSIKLYDLGGLPYPQGPYAEAVAMLGWDPIGLQWLRVHVDTSGNLVTSGSGGTGGGGGVQYQELSTVGAIGTGNLILGHDTGGIARVPTVGSFANSTAMAVQIVDASGNQIVSFGGGTTTVVSGTASNFQATVTGTVAATQSGGWTVTVTQPTGTNLHVVVDNGTVTAVPSGTQNVNITGGTVVAGGTTTVVGTVTSVPSGTQNVALTGTGVVTGTVSLLGGTSTATISGLTTDYSPNIQQALLVRDRDLARSIEQLALELIKTREAVLPLTVGPQQSSDGMAGPFRACRTGALVTTDAHGRYTEAVIRKKVYTAYAVVPPNNQQTTPSGLILYNPINSGVYLVLLNVGLSCGSTPPVIGNAYNYRLETPLTGNIAAPTGTTAVNMFSNILGTPYDGKAIAYSSATFAVAPVPFLPIQTVISSSTGTAGANSIAANSFVSGLNTDFAGLVALAPGSYLAFAQGGSTAINANMSFTWEELFV